MARLLLVEDEPSLQLALGDTLVDEGYSVAIAGTVAQGLAELERETPDVVITDLRLPDGEGLEVLRAVQQDCPGVPVIVLTAYASVASAVEAMHLGAAEYLTKPFEDSQLLAIVARHVELSRLRRRVQELEGAPPAPLGEDREFRRVVEAARAAAASDVTVLLEGETGTGKEVLARFLHASSPRRAQPFVAVSCAALPEALLESELFGHERGAFTGAIRTRRGRFEEAHRGTLFLDEIAEATPPVQAKLLRVLEQRSFERLGSNATIRVDVRIVAATKCDLAQEVEAGRFRDDLYYRLKVVPLRLPPLRERPSDIPLLAVAFATEVGARLGRHLTFAAETLERLAAHPFPGNVRELRHLIEYLAAVLPVDRILPEHLPGDLSAPPAVILDANRLALHGSLAEMSASFEREVLLRMLERHAGHRGRIADELGISRKNLWEKLKAHGLGE
jgi:DNA-binding NtrC family response regulator